MKPESQNLDDYLVSDDVVDWRNPEVEGKALALAGGTDDPIAKVRILFKWVRDKVPHTKDIGGDVVTCSASEVLQQRTGICMAKSHLLAALLRANGIPTGFCYQVLRRDPPHAGMVLHGLNGVYLGGPGKWIRLDPRGNTGTIDARFDVEREKLAFPMDAGAGEFIYETIFRSPAPVVVKTLRTYTNCEELWPHLPCSLK